MSWLYSDQVKEHFKNPRNILKDDENFEESGRGDVGNIKCGDEMMMVIKVDEATQTIADCRWKTYGCASAIASTSALSEMIKGMTLEKAFQISPKDVVAALGALPDNKIHCSVLGDKALRAAINDYYKRSGKKDKVREDVSKVVCTCNDVTDHDIEEAVLEGARTYAELQDRTKIGTVCGDCEEEARKLMETYIHIHFS